MKKLLYSLLTLAAALTVASCQQELEGGSVYDDGTTVDATFAVNLGPQTKAFADGTTVDKLYAGIYEIGTNNAYTWVADNADAPVAINTGGASVTFNGKITLGKSYKVVFWAQKDGAPYTIDWAKSATSGPNVTATATGAANDESRDAFYGACETGAVTGNIDLTSSPVTLKRPFAQVNVLVPTANFVDATAAVTSSMTVAQAPTVLNLATKATSDPADWTFTTAAIGEDAFGSYASTHKYVAMNYVLVDQTAADPRYDVTFSVTSDTQVASDKQVKNAPLKVNGRTNIVGNIFDTNFNITVPVIIDPGVGTDQVLTTVTVAVGQTAADAVELTFDPANPASTSIEIGVSHPVEVEADKPQITVEPATVATAEWNLTTGKLDVTPLVANGNAVITLVFPAVTKTEYSSATVQVYVKVGNGQNEELEQVAAPTFTPAAGEYTAAQSVEIACATEGAAIYYTTDGTDPTAASTAYTAAIAVGETMTIKAIAVKEGMTDSEIATAAYTISAAAKQDQTLSFAEDAQAATMGEAYTLQEVSGAQTAVTYTSSEASVATIEGTTITLMGAGTTTITATAAADDTYNEGTASYTLTVNAPSALTNPVVFNFADIYSAAEGNLELSTETVAPITLTFDKNEAGGGATIPAFNKNAGEVRLYSNNKLTISSEKYITKVEFTFVDDYGTTSAAFNEDAFNPSEATWTGSSKSLVITNPSANQIRFTEIKVTWSDEPATWPAMDPSLSFAEPSVSIAAGAKATQVATSATGYKGAITYSSSNTAVATVNATTGQVTAVAQGTATITATSEPNDRYTAGTASYSVTVTAAVDGPQEETIEGTFDFNDGALSLTTDSGITITQEKGTGTTNVNSTYNTATTLRVYKGHTLTFTAPSGKTITAIAFTNTNQYKGCNGIASDVGTFTSQVNCTWTGSASTIVITNDGTDNTQFRPTQIVVTYE